MAGDPPPGVGSKTTAWNYYYYYYYVGGTAGAYEAHTTRETTQHCWPGIVMLLAVQKLAYL